MEKFEVGKTYEAVYALHYHCHVTVAKKTSCYVTFRLDERMQRYFRFNKPEVQRRYKVVEGCEVATLSGTSVDSYRNWVVCAYDTDQ